MDLTSQKEIKKFLKENGIRPSKRMGQNFLIDKTVLQKLISSSNINKDSVILEVGPGLGVITKELAKRVKKVVVVEKDQKMINLLKQSLKNINNVEIIKGDALKERLLMKDYKVVANIPYYITAPLIRKFLESKNPPKEIFLIIQKEVAQRICSSPPKMSILAISVQFYAKPEIVSYIKKSSFWPQPKVDSAIIKIKPEYKYNINPENFFSFIKAGFSHPRKQLVNNLVKELQLNKEDIKPILKEKRAETLSIEEWVELTKLFNY